MFIYRSSVRQPSAKEDTVVGRQLINLVDELAQGNVYLDCERVAYLPGVELGKLVTLWKKLKGEGRRLVLCNVQPQVYEVFRVTHLTRLMEICRDGPAERSKPFESNRHGTAKEQSCSIRAVAWRLVMENLMRPNLLIGNALYAPSEVDIPSGQLPPVVLYRHRYLCWICRHEGVLEFEPGTLEPSWTECHHCGLDNEIPPGRYDRPTVIPGQVPSRIV